MNQLVHIRRAAMVSTFAATLVSVNSGVSGQSVIRASVSSLGVEGNLASEYVGLSGDGRYIAFSSFANNLVPGDSPSTFNQDVFVHDRMTGQTEWASVRSDGTPANSGSWGSNISADGRFVAFYSAATDMTSHGGRGAFVRDRTTGVTSYLCVNAQGESSTIGGNQGFYGRIALSTDGRYVAFESDRLGIVPGDTNARTDIFVMDRDKDGNGIFDEPGGMLPVRVSVNASGEQGNNYSRTPTMTGDGRFVVFSSESVNLTPTNDPNAGSDIFVHDRDADANGVFDEANGVMTECISVAMGGTQTGDSISFWGSISANGRYVVFSSVAADLVPGDSNVVTDVFLRDRVLGQTMRISMRPNGDQATSANLYPEISEDGRYVSYLTSDSGIVPGDLNNGTDTVVYDRFTRVTRFASVNAQNQQTGPLGTPLVQWHLARFSSTGRYVGFASMANDVVPNDTNNQWDVFWSDRGTKYPFNISGDQTINIDDLVALITTWGACQPAPIACPADLNGDGAINIDDLVLIITNWG